MLQSGRVILAIALKTVISRETFRCGEADRKETERQENR